MMRQLLSYTLLTMGIVVIHSLLQAIF